jgi:hypothetical protein
MVVDVQGMFILVILILFPDLPVLFPTPRVLPNIYLAVGNQNLNQTNGGHLQNPFREL